jgi:hypothetical protein
MKTHNDNDNADHPAPAAVRTGRRWLMAGVALTDIARVAWVCESVAALAWACAMLREGGFTRTLGVIGLVSGALPAVAVIAAGQAMTEQVVVGILLVQGIWNFTAATYLLRGAKLAPRTVQVPASASQSAQVNLAR